MQTVELTIKDQVASLRFNRPDTHNAFNALMINEIRQCVKQVSTSDARVLVIEAAGKSFSAGADLNWMRETAKQSPEANKADALALAGMLNELFTCPLVTIAKVQGNAFGGGVGLIACCDIAIATSNAKFALSEVKLGLTPATISPYVINAIGARHAKALFVTGELFNSQRAQSINLLHTVVDEPQVLTDRVNATIKAVLANGPNAISISKQLVDAVNGEPIDESQQEKLAQLIADVRASDEGQEGLTAFLEKRPASFNLSSKDKDHS